MKILSIKYSPISSGRKCLCVKGGPWACLKPLCVSAKAVYLGRSRCIGQHYVWNVSWVSPTYGSLRPRCLHLPLYDRLYLYRPGLLWQYFAARVARERLVSPGEPPVWHRTPLMSHLVRAAFCVRHVACHVACHPRHCHRRIALSEITIDPLAPEEVIICAAPWFRCRMGDVTRQFP